VDDLFWVITDPLV